MKTQNWCKLDDEFYRRKNVKKLARKHGPTAIAYWTVLIARAHDASHHLNNPEGVIDCTLQDLADEIYDPSDPTPIFEDLLSFGMIRRVKGNWKDGVEADLHLVLTDFHEWQAPKGGAKYRKLTSRNDAETQDLQGTVTGVSQVGTDVSQVGSSLDGCVTGVDELVTQTHTQTHTHTLANASTIDMSESPAGSSDDKPVSDLAEVTSVFEHWVAETWDGIGPRPKRSPQRVACIRGRHKDGFTYEQMKQAISGYARTPYYRGENKDGRKYLAITLFLRNIEKVERGLELYERPEKPKPILTYQERAKAANPDFQYDPEEYANVFPLPVDGGSA